MTRGKRFFKQIMVSSPSFFPQSMRYDEFLYEIKEWTAKKNLGLINWLSETNGKLLRRL